MKSTLAPNVLNGLAAILVAVAVWMIRRYPSLVLRLLSPFVRQARRAVAKGRMAARQGAPLLSTCDAGGPRGSRA